MIDKSIPSHMITSKNINEFLLYLHSLMVIQGNYWVVGNFINTTQADNSMPYLAIASRLSLNKTYAIYDTYILYLTNYKALLQRVEMFTRYNMFTTSSVPNQDIMRRWGISSKHMCQLLQQSHTGWNIDSIWICDFMHAYLVVFYLHLKFDRK